MNLPNMVFFLFLLAFIPMHASGLEKGRKKEEPKDSDQKKLCIDFEGKFIGYYGTVFRVADCKRQELSAEQAYRLTQKKPGELIEVDSYVVAGIPPGDWFSDAKVETDSVCDRYEKRYATFSFVDVFWIEGCVIREFPDWSSYEHHRGKLRSDKVALMPLSYEEMQQMEKGTPMPSVIDEEFRELLRPDNIDLLPLAEACRGLIGRHVTYLGEIYEIVAQRKPSEEKGACAKKVIDAQEFTRSKAGKKFQLAELSSSQSLSIPILKTKSETKSEK